MDRLSYLPTDIGRYSINYWHTLNFQRRKGRKNLDHFFFALLFSEFARSSVSNGF